MSLKILNKIFRPSAPKPVLVTTEPIKVVVVAFDDACQENSGEVLSRYLSDNPLFFVSYFDENFNKTFLNMQSRNFFDFVDMGKTILKRTKADVLIWGYREQDKIRLNFQTLRQYEKVNPPSFSLMDSLYLPLTYFQGRQFPASMLNIVCGAIVAATDDQRAEIKQARLSKIIALISKQSSPADLSIEYMPYILNILGLIYLHATQEVVKNNGLKIISGLLENALKNQYVTKDVLLLGSLYANLGQLYYCAAESSTYRKHDFCRKAVEYCQASQKYFNRYAYPYDFGLQAYRLSLLYFMYWKQTSDVQALRDAVFQLRDAEKIFSNIAFPYFWATIQGDLGFYLSLLGLFSRNDEISMLAVENYKKRQKIYSKELRPLEWAKIQENIGNIFYNSGKQFDDEEYLEEAIKYYNTSDEIYENNNMVNEQRQMRICIAKAEECILRLRHK